ncbi:MAG TPA: BadF/BadG/BcrA/BcrD ATPase family protein [Steroidobacteraceae bacterium]|nr:BadF/BadG/BcrA/BcrD ATPase family protein [Steroidobacteraceae bacterium]
MTVESTGRFFLGVDGGGTKTRFALIDDQHQLIGEATLGTTYHPDVGVDGVRNVLARGVTQIMSGAGIDATQLAYAFFGLPAHGEDSAVTPALDALPRAILGHDRFAVGNDMVCGWAGSLAAEDGINIVAGTGSIGYGQRGARAARAGGWGEAFSDEGSAYWIAMQGLNVYSRMSDGRLPRGPLYTLINETLQLANDLDLCAQVYGENAKSRGELAQLSPLVTRAAALGDAHALDIFRRAGQELAGIAEALRQQLGFEAGEKVRLSYSGGAFAAGDVLMMPFRQALAAASPAFELCQPLHEPQVGAALYAAKLSAR